LRVALTRPPPAALDTLSLHDALPICDVACRMDRGVPGHFQRAEVLFHAAVVAGDLQVARNQVRVQGDVVAGRDRDVAGTGIDDEDRKSTRLNSSHVKISYAVFCLKKK